MIFFQVLFMLWFSRLLVLGGVPAEWLMQVGMLLPAVGVKDEWEMDNLLPGWYKQLESWKERPDVKDEWA